MGRVNDKVAIVTGAASGLGFAAAQKLMNEGAKVMLSDINREVIESMPDRLNNFSRAQFSAFTHDVTNEDAWIELIDKTEQEFGQINILVNSAGISLGADIVSTDFKIWKKVHEVNLDGVFLGCKYALPLMRKSGNGSIINISSISGIVAGHNFAAYNSAKAGVRHLSKSVALHCARTTDLVRCNSIHPVFAKTEMMQAFFENASEELLGKLEKQIPIRKFAESIDVANGILFLASDESKMITGTELVIDGGLSAQ